MGEVGGEEVSTIFVGGLPQDATSRELDNLCRFMQGFQTSKVEHRKGLVFFARFSTPREAEAAVEALNGKVFDRANPGEPLRVAMARSNMRRSDGAPPIAGGWNDGGHAPRAYSPMFVPVSGTPGTPPPPATPPPASLAFAHEQRHTPLQHSRWRKRLPPVDNPDGIDTVASVGALDAGFDEGGVATVFASFPGFVTFKPNPRMGGGFAKYTSAAAASEAVALALEHGLPAAIAKSSMTNAGPAQHVTSAVSHSHTVYEAPYHGMGGMAAKRPRFASNGAGVDTLACVGAFEAGYDDRVLEEMFQDLQGFVAYKSNPRMGGGFAKFDSHENAMEALHALKKCKVPVELAKSSMSSAPK